MHTLTLDIPTRRSALSSLSVYFIFELRSKLTRSYGCSSVTASERTEIIKQVAYIFDDISGEKFKRHILKFTKAG